MKITHEAQYIMVTKWDNHWDGLGSGSTKFTKPAIRGVDIKSLPAEAITLFIKLSATNAFEKAWIGKSKNFKEDTYGKEGVRFEVSDLQEVACPSEFTKLKGGWYPNTTALSLNSLVKDTVEINALHPSFFRGMATVGWQQFEQHCFQLLRTIGIHDIHCFPQSDNRGKADGFFRFQTLTVIYDATLESNFLEQKEQQIENYVNQLKKEKVAFGPHSYTIKDTQRQVWIITRGKEVRHIKTEDHIKVKEIPYTKLIEVYDRRLMDDSIGRDDLWDMLKDME